MASERPEIYVYPEWGWTCQDCLATTKGYDSQEAANKDADNHTCEVYE